MKLFIGSLVLLFLEYAKIPWLHLVSKILLWLILTYSNITLLSCWLVSNEVPEAPVVSPSSGAVFEKRVIEKYIIENGVDPINGKELRIEELIEIKSEYNQLWPKNSLTVQVSNSDEHWFKYLYMTVSYSQNLPRKLLYLWIIKFFIDLVLVYLY